MELMGAVVISMIIIMLLFKIFDKVQSVFVVSQNRARAMEQGRIAMDMLAKDFQFLAAADLSDPAIGEMANIEWANPSFEKMLKHLLGLRLITSDRSKELLHAADPKVEFWDELVSLNNAGDITPADARVIYKAVFFENYLSPVRRFYIKAIDMGSMTFQVENIRGPSTNGYGGGDKFRFPQSRDLYEVVSIDPSQTRYTFDLWPPGGASEFDHDTNDPLRFEVEVEAVNDASDSLGSVRQQAYKDMSQDLYHHHCKFFTNNGGWRYVEYRFGGRENYKQPPRTSPFGALWVYRSRKVAPSDLLDEIVVHRVLVDSDDVSGPLDDPFGYARVLDGVIHFQVRAASPRDPGRALVSPRTDSAGNTIYTGDHAPSHVEVELAVADRNLVKEIEEGLGQRLEGETDPGKIYQTKLKYLSENLDRVYFFKQLIPIQ